MSGTRPAPGGGSPGYANPEVAADRRRRYGLARCRDVETNLANKHRWDGQLLLSYSLRCSRSLQRVRAGAEI
jgi:hypothetical protein